MRVLELGTVDLDDGVRVSEQHFCPGLDDARLSGTRGSEEEKRSAETSGGYAREMSDDYKRRQAALIAERAKAADIVITTALIPGRPAPLLVTDETLQGMKPGSVVVDLAVKQGGNCALSVADQVTLSPNGVKVVAPSSLPAGMAADASALYARNLLHFVNLLLDAKTGELTIDRADEIVAGTMVCAEGAAAPSPGRS